MSVWIESHQALEKSHKLFDLMAAMGWSKAEAIGHLHLFWWWCVDQAEDGDLRKFTASHMALASDVPIANAEAFQAALLNAGFIETDPYLRIRNWWQYLGRFLKVRYGKKPEKWQPIEKLYSQQQELDLTAGDPTGDQPDQPTGNRTVAGMAGDITKPNQTKPNKDIKPLASQFVEVPSYEDVCAYCEAGKGIPLGFIDWWYEKRTQFWGWTRNDGQPIKWKEAVARAWARQRHKSWETREQIEAQQNQNPIPASTPSERGANAGGKNQRVQKNGF